MASKFDKYERQIKEIIEADEFITNYDVVRKIIGNPDASELKTFGKHIGRHRAKIIDKDVFISEASTKTNEYSNEKKGKIFNDYGAIHTDGHFMEIKEYCEFYKLDYSQVTSYKYLSYLNPPCYNIAFRIDKQEELEQEIDFTSIFKHLKQSTYVPLYKVNQCLFDRFVYTDVHIGMKIEDFSLYGGVWDEKALDRRLNESVNNIIHNRKSTTLVIDELGDFLDGYDGYTTRGGHKLPQNMDNQKAFDTGLGFKIKMIQMLVPYYDTIICHNVCEDNHAGSFGYIVNSAFKTAIEIMFPNVQVNNQRKFIEHYTIQNHTFILTHGKDSKSLKFGFKPHLDKIQENKIDNYIKEHYLLQKGVKIEFSKGDSHQYIFDNATSQSFNYYNYPAFSISSAWVQANFQKGISGAMFFNYYPDRKTFHEILF